ncbi:MAG: HDOD domain-containing protein [Thermodesulfobacteriota bacterium]
MGGLSGETGAFQDHQADMSARPQGHIPKAQVIENFKRLYPMPHVLIKARRIIADPRAGFEQLAAVLQTDPAVAGRIVKVANSAYFRRSGNISSVRQATTLLGMRIVTQIITMVSQSKKLGQAVSGYGMEAGVLWRHSLSVAILAELLARRTRWGELSEAFLAGLMHDAGKIILDSYLVQQAGDARRPGPVSGVDAVDMEMGTLGFDHADIGCELCIKWQLPIILANAIRFHHMPHMSGHNKLAYILNLADYIAHRLNKPPEDSDSWCEAENELAYLGLSLEDATETAAMLAERLETLEEDTF